MTKAEQIAAELEAIGGSVLLAEEVVEWAKTHPESALHSQFEWDDSEAAREYRLYQARRVIAVYVRADDGERSVVSLSIDRKKEGGGYRKVEEVIKDEQLRKVLVRDALSEFKRVKRKYEHIRELASVYAEIEKADMQYGESVQQSAVAA